MVRELNPLETAQARLVQELFSQADLPNCCPFIKRDAQGPYCAKGLEGGTRVTSERRGVCDTDSLQLWCLDPERYSKCSTYNGESFLT